MRGFRPFSQPIPRLALPTRSLHRPLSSIQPVTITITPGSLRGVMSSQREDSIPHELRTAAEPRQNRLYPVLLSHVEQVNPSIRLLQFTIPGEESNVCPTYCLNLKLPFCFLLYSWSGTRHDMYICFGSSMPTDPAGPSKIYIDNQSNTIFKTSTADYFCRMTMDNNNHSLSSQANG